MNVKQSLNHGLKAVKNIRIRQDAWLVVIIVALVALPAWTLHNAPIVGIYTNALCAVILASMSLLFAPAKKIAIVAAVMLVSLMVPMSLGNTSDFAKTACLYGVVLLLSLAYRFVFTEDRVAAENLAKNKHDTLPIKRLSRIREYATHLPQGLIVGQFLGGLAFLLLPHVRPFSGASLGLVLAVAVVFAIIEIIFFQSLLQASASETTSAPVAICVTIALYVCVSASISIQTLIMNIVAGTVFAVAFYLRKNTLPIMFANATMKLVFIGLVVATAR